MSKRKYDPKTSVSSKRSADLDSTLTSLYSGYFPEEKVTNIDVIDLPTTPDAITEFYQNYVISRKPCVISEVSSKELLLKELAPTEIASTLPHDEILQVERKVDGGFGSGETRLKMSFGEFMAKIDAGETNLYLTTQYVEDDPDLEEQSYSDSISDVEEDDDEEDEEEGEIPGGFADVSDAESLNFNDVHDDFEELNDDITDDSVVCALDTGPLTTQEADQRIKELYQPPMTNLVKRLPETPEFLASLIPQQINLWIGSATSSLVEDSFLKNFNPSCPKLGLGRNVPGGGCSSGLHHDHADNIYIPVNGRKRFTLFSPGDAAKMYTVGTIRKLFDSGVVDYVRDEASPSWRSLRDDGAVLAEVAKQELATNVSLTEDEKKELIQIIETDENDLEDIDVHTDPPSFSKVPPAIVHIDKIKDYQLRQKIRAAALQRWPLFFKANRIIVDLNPGQMLYLPTGWFHEVTSFGKENLTAVKDGSHIAVNYWFIPPNGTAISNLYPHHDKYWPLDYERTKAALVRAREST